MASYFRDGGPFRSRWYSMLPKNVFGLLPLPRLGTCTDCNTIVKPDANSVMCCKTMPLEAATEHNSSSRILPMPPHLGCGIMMDIQYSAIPSVSPDQATCRVVPSELAVLPESQQQFRGEHGPNRNGPTAELRPGDQHSQPRHIDDKHNDHPKL